MSNTLRKASKLTTVNMCCALAETSTYLDEANNCCARKKVNLFALIKDSCEKNSCCAESSSIGESNISNKPTGPASSPCGMTLSRTTIESCVDHFQQVFGGVQ